MQNNDWFNKLCDDTNFSANEPYSHKRLITYLEAVAEDLENLKPFELLAAIYEFTRAFTELSTALSVGFSDITSKVDIWRNNFKTFYKDCKSMQEVMELEIKMQIHQFNSENNYDFGIKKTSPYYYYASGTRTLLRLSWFMHFLLMIFKNMVNTEDAFNTCVTNAYEEVLAPHHPWMVRKAAGFALSFAPSARSNALKIFFGNFIFILNCLIF